MLVEAIATMAALTGGDLPDRERPAVRCERRGGGERAARSGRRGSGASASASSRAGGSSSSSSSVSVSSSSSNGRSRARAVSSITDEHGRTITVIHDERGCRVIVDPEV